MPEEDRRDESSGESKEILHIPKEQMEEFLAKIQAHIKEMKEETKSEIVGLRKEVKDFKARPFEDVIENLGVEIKGLTEKIAKTELNSAILEVKPILESEVRSRVVEASNRVYGAEDKTLEDSIRTQEKRRFWSKFRAWSYATAASFALFLGGYALYDSSQRTAESAVGVAKKAKEMVAISLEESKASRVDMNIYKTESDAWRKKNEEDKKREYEARRKEQSELEQKLAGQIGAKADKTGYDAKFADLKKDYDRLDGMLQAELKKNEGREDAYVKYKELADATKALVDSTKSTLDELVKNYREFEKEVATKENIEIKIATIRDAIENEIKQRIKDYDNLITRMQEVYNKNDEEIKKFRELLNNIEDSYKEIEKRVQKLEEKREK